MECTVGVYTNPRSQGQEAMPGDMAVILLSGSWTLIFLDLAMWSFLFGVPAALIVLLVRKLKSR